jgi:hypothetical protein
MYMGSNVAVLAGLGDCLYGQQNLTGAWLATRHSVTLLAMPFFYLSLSTAWVFLFTHIHVVSWYYCASI